MESVHQTLVKPMTIVHLMKGNVVEGAFGSYTVGQRHDIVPGPVKDGRWVVQRRPRMCSCDLNKGPRHDDRFVPSGGWKVWVPDCSHASMACWPRVEATNSS